MMEDLIQFLLFIGVGLLLAIGKMQSKKKKKRGAKARESEGLTTRINAWLTSLQKHIETQSKKTAGVKTGWEQLIGGSRPVRPQTDPSDGTIEDVDLGAGETTPSPPPRTAPTAPPPQPHLSIRPAENPTSPAIEIPQRPPTVRRKPNQAVLPMQRTGLRQAVVWSEILGPPVALRDPFGDNR